MYTTGLPITSEDYTPIKQHAVKPGFTLIELLVVIAIISILATILLPSLSSAGILAKNIACISNQRAISTSIQMYSTDNSGYYPVSYMLPVSYLNTHMSLLLQYGIEPVEGHYVCPADETPFHGARQIDVGAANIEGDYSYNYNLFFGGQRFYPGNSMFRPRRVDDVPFPAKQLLLLDGEVGGNWYWFTSINDYNIASSRHAIGSAQTGFNITLADGANVSVTLPKVTNLESQGGDYYVWPIN